MKRMMMLSAMLVMASLVLGQVEDRFGFIGSQAGISIPLGMYGKKTFDESAEVGLAMTGFCSGSAFSYAITDNIGAALLYTRQKHAIDQTALSSYSDRVSTTSFESSNVLAGLLLTFNAGALDVDMKGLVGMISMTHPPMTISGIMFGEGYMIGTSEAKVQTFSYSLGAGFRYAVSNELALSLNCDYIAAKPTFKFTIDSSEGILPAESTEYDVSMLNLSLGLGYRIL